MILRGRRLSQVLAGVLTTACLLLDGLPNAFAFSPVLAKNSRCLGTLFSLEASVGPTCCSLPSDLVQSLDLAQILEQVAAHAGTRRGRYALLSLVGRQEKAGGYKRVKEKEPAMKRRAQGLDFRPQRRSRRETSVEVAASDSEARQAYELTEQAMSALCAKDGSLDGRVFPPLYGADSDPWDTKTIVQTDDDDWLTFESVEDWTLEHILQAEQVINMIVRVHEWSQTEGTQTWMPLLASIVDEIAVEDLQQILHEIEGAVVVSRTRSISDPEGRASFCFQLNDDKFPVLSILRQREQDIRRVDELESLSEEIDALERGILQGLVQTVSSQRDAIDKSLCLISQLDVIVAKAAYGCTLNGCIPNIQSDGCVNVCDFVHPLLNPETLGERTVPVNLRLYDKRHVRALVISGPNGGGKTLAMKSFGVVAVFAKLGIPIPVRFTSQAHPQPRIDYFQHVLASIGDGQDVAGGESTFTAQLNSYSSLLDRVACENDAKNKSSSFLVLVDEIGSGTEASAGGAIAQAVLEKLLEVDSIRVVVTTHSARLKALSYRNDSEMGCAAVLLKSNAENNDRYQLPSFQLEYGLIGESYALGAASRCQLPEDVLTRASALMTEDSSDSSREGEGSTFNQELRKSLQNQLSLTEKARESAESFAKDMFKCRRAMVTLASAYDRQLAQLENRIETCYAALRDAGTDELELVGEVLVELRTVHKRVKTEKELLRERGLRLLPFNHDLKEGDSVVIVADGEWDGTTASVFPMGPDSLEKQGFAAHDVAVIPSLLCSPDPTSDNKLKPLVFPRHQVAIWDYDSVWEDDHPMLEDDVKSIPDSKRRLSSILSALHQSSSPPSRQEKTKPPSTPVVRDGKGDSPSRSFTSARERKAARRKKSSRKK